MMEYKVTFKKQEGESDKDFLERYCKNTVKKGWDVYSWFLATKGESLERGAESLGCSIVEFYADRARVGILCHRQSRRDLGYKRFLKAADCD